MPDTMPALTDDAPSGVALYRFPSGPARVDAHRDVNVVRFWLVVIYPVVGVLPALFLFGTVARGGVRFGGALLIATLAGLAGAAALVRWFV